MSLQVETSVINLKVLSERNLHIPEYQSPYTRTYKNAVQLLEDVINFSKYPIELICFFLISNIVK